MKMQLSTQHLIVSLSCIAALIVLELSGHDAALPIDTLCAVIGASGYGSIIHDDQTEISPSYKGQK